MPLILDLHGVSHEDVTELVHSFINENWRPNQELTIITGMSVKMKVIVNKVLALYDLEVLHQPSNPGCLLVHTWHE